MSEAAARSDRRALHSQQILAAPGSFVAMELSNNIFYSLASAQAQLLPPALLAVHLCALLAPSLRPTVPSVLDADPIEKIAPL